jgi:hypothetical protein
MLCTNSSQVQTVSDFAFPVKKAPELKTPLPPENKARLFQGEGILLIICQQLGAQYSQRQSAKGGKQSGQVMRSLLQFNLTKSIDPEGMRFSVGTAHQ